MVSGIHNFSRCPFRKDIGTKSDKIRICVECSGKGMKYDFSDILLLSRVVAAQTGLIRMRLFPEIILRAKRLSHPAKSGRVNAMVHIM